MPRDVLLLEEMIEAADQAVALVHGVDVAGVAADRMWRAALLWNFAVLQRERTDTDEAALVTAVADLYVHVDGRLTQQMLPRARDRALAMQVSDA